MQGIGPTERTELRHRGASTELRQHQFSGSGASTELGGTLQDSTLVIIAD